MKRTALSRVDCHDSVSGRALHGVNDGSSVERGVDQILKSEGRLDLVVNNAGIALAGAIEDIDVAEAKALFETNFYGVLRVCQAAFPAMRSQGSGRLVESLCPLPAI